MSMLRWMTSAALVLTLRPRPPWRSSRKSRPDRPRDSVLNGALIGAAAGVAGAFVFTRINCGPPGYDSECQAIAGPVGVLIMVPAGMVIGALIDRSIGKNRR